MAHEPVDLLQTVNKKDLIAREQVKFPSNGKWEHKSDINTRASIQFSTVNRKK